jgi:hypothetical protein
VSLLFATIAGFTCCADLHPDSSEEGETMAASNRHLLNGKWCANHPFSDRRNFLKESTAFAGFSAFQLNTFEGKKWDTWSLQQRV